MTIHTHLPPDLAAAHAHNVACLSDLRARISRQIEADLARVDRCLSILNAFDGDPDLEDGGDDEPSLGSLGGSHLLWSRCSADDREDGDDTGVADVGGLAEQRCRHLVLVHGGAA